jgi:hypothetical protein
MQNEIFSDPRGRSEPPARSRTPLSARYRHRNEEECGVTPFQRVSYALNYYKVERSNGLLSFDQTLPPSLPARLYGRYHPLLPRGFRAFRNTDQSVNSLLARAVSLDNRRPMNRMDDLRRGTPRISKAITLVKTSWREMG